MSVWPGQLAGMHEAAKILGVSGARVGQLRVSDPSFPKPLDILRSGPVWFAEHLIRYDAARNKTSGRRKKG